MKYQPCLSEAETVERAIAGANLARYGDGEFNIIIGRSCTSQRADKGLAAEMRAILVKAPKGCLPCLPTPYGGTPKKANWQRYENYDIEIGAQEYGSAFITRADSAPWIDTATYWDRVRDLWRGKDVVLVKGSDRSLREATLHDAKSVRIVHGTYRDAYDARGLTDRRDNPAACRTVGELMEAIGRPGRTILLCLGATATVMAARFAVLGEHAIDVGHLGMFMRHAGAYKFKALELASEPYREQLKAVYAANPKWGDCGHTHAENVNAFADELEAQSILDYGAGSGSLQKRMSDDYKRRVVSYDPAFGSGLPKPVDLLVCTDVLEHIEPNLLGNVLAHIHSLAGRGAYVTISNGQSKETLPDGRNAHLVVQPPKFWLDKMEGLGWKHARPPVTGKGLTMWLLR